MQTLNSHFNLPSRSLWSLPTYKRVWSAVHLSYCTTQTAPHHTLSFQKGEKQQQLSGKCTIILPLKEGDWVKIVTVTVAFLIWHRGMKSCLKAYKGGKTNCTFAINILVFVPLKNTWKMSVNDTFKRLHNHWKFLWSTKLTASNHCRLTQEMILIFCKKKKKEMVMRDVNGFTMYILA